MFGEDCSPLHNHRNSSPNPLLLQREGEVCRVVIPLYFQERGTEGVS